VQDLVRGPGRLATELDITGALDSHDLCAGGPLWLGDAWKIAPLARMVVCTAEGTVGLPDMLAYFQGSG
jgi:hypothetical protein